MAATTDEAGLGAEEEVHRVRKSRVAIPAVLAGLVLLSAVAQWLGGRLTPGLFGLVVAAVVVVLIADLAPTLTRVVWVHQDGLRVSALQGIAQARWDELEALYLDAKVRLLPLPGEHRLYLGVVLEAGERRLRFDDELEGFEPLLQRVVAAVHHNTGEELLDRFARGQTVWFGPLEVGPMGLACEGLEWPWSEISEADTAWGMLTLDGGSVCPLGLVANAPVLLELLRRREVRVDALEQRLRLKRCEE